MFLVYEGRIGSAAREIQMRGDALTEGYLYRGVREPGAAPGQLLS